MVEALPAIDELPFVWRRKVFLWRIGDALQMDPVTMKVEPELGKTVYFVDESASAVIEFARSLLVHDGSMLTRGRLWADTHYVHDGQWVRKPADEFASWFSGLVSWVRKNYVRLPEGPPDFWIGLWALEWHRAGGRLQP